MKYARSLQVSAALLIAASAAGAQHQHPSSEKLGTVHFANSCAPAVAPGFDRAIALLHSFEFGPAIRGFNEVIAADSGCAIARWGIALARWGNPMAPNLRAPATLEQGRRAAREGLAMRDRATPRERAFIEAVQKLYDDYETVSQPARIAAYEKAMSEVATANIGDTEASVFYALSLVGAALPSDKTYANQLRAGAMLEAMWARHPDHPGLAHYIIHAYDVPALAPQARAAAQRYADIAPSAAHALHMPSHTFTRVGLWDESVATNLRSMEAARRDSSIGEELHAMDYAVYAYLQMRRDTSAKAIIDRLPDIQSRYDVNVVRGAAGGSAGMFALAAMPARYAIERRDWRTAADIVPSRTAFRYADAISWFARALGAANTGDRGRARFAIDTLAAISASLAAAGEAYWAEQVHIQMLEARAALYVAEGSSNEAMRTMLEAVKRENATEKSAVTPGPIVPANELLADMYLEQRRHREALAHYREAMVKEPNRFRSLYGAMKAANGIGDRKLEGEFAAQIEKLTGTSTWAK